MWTIFEASIYRYKGSYNNYIKDLYKAVGADITSLSVTDEYVCLLNTILSLPEAVAMIEKKLMRTKAYHMSQVIFLFKLFSI